VQDSFDALQQYLYNPLLDGNGLAHMDSMLAYGHHGWQHLCSWPVASVARHGTDSEMVRQQDRQSESIMTPLQVMLQGHSKHAVWV